MTTAQHDGTVDADWAYNLVAEMSQRFTHVLSGSDKEAAAAEAIKEQFDHAGIPCEIYTFPGLISHPRSATLAAGAASGPLDSYPCNALAQSEPADGLDAELVYLGAGGSDDYVGQDVAGRVVLVELSYAPPRPEKMRLAKKHGAVGMVMVNWGPDDNPAMPNGTVKSVWGNPTRDTAEDMITLPAVGVTRPDGLELRRLATESQGAWVRLSTDVDRRWRTCHLPLAWLGHGPESDRPFVLVGGHFDSWGSSVTDNLCSNAGMIAIARALKAREHELVRDVAFGFWPGHESGIMIGSTWFVDRHWDLLRDRCVAYVNLDSIGMSGYTLWSARAAAELRQTVRTTDPPAEIAWGRPEKIGDQSFFGLGIPSVDCRSGPTAQQKAEEHGAVLGWWYHSDHDTLDKLDPQTYASDLTRISGYVSRLATEPLLPFDPADVADEVVTRLDEIAGDLEAASFDADAAGFGWSRIRQAATRFSEASSKFGASLEALGAPTNLAAEAAKIEVANMALRRVATLTIPVRYAAVHRHTQDTYGQSRLAHIFPELDAVLDFAHADTDDDANYISTEAMRARNRLIDALLEATQVLTSATARLA